MSYMSPIRDESHPTVPGNSTTMPGIAAGYDTLRTTREPCLLHKSHVPNSHINERHHVWPLGEGGPNTNANIVVVCATGHNNIHDLIKLMKVHRGKVPYAILRTFSFGEREVAKLGYDRITRGAM